MSGDAEQVDALVDAVVGRFGRLDLVVNNAGGAPYVDSGTASPRLTTSILALNLAAPFFVSQAANRVMQAQDDGGVIVNIGSVSALRPSPGAAVYGAAKAGLWNLTQTVAIDWGPKVRVNFVSAGLIETEQAEAVYGDRATVDRVAAAVPLGRMGTPSDVADTVVFLASPDAAFISGSNIVVDGGGELRAPEPVCGPRVATGVGHQARARERGPAADRGGAGLLGVVPVDLPVGEALQHLVERDAALEPGERGAEAEVEAVAEAQVVVDRRGGCRSGRRRGSGGRRGWPSR